MARHYRTHIHEEKAVEICVDVTDLEKYKEAWLWLHNNAREYPKSLLKVWNNSGDSIYVLVSPDCADNLKSIMEDWGEIKFVREDKVVAMIDVWCDFDNFDKDYVDYEYVIGEED